MRELQIHNPNGYWGISSLVAGSFHYLCHHECMHVILCSYLVNQSKKSTSFWKFFREWLSRLTYNQEKYISSRDNYNKFKVASRKEKRTHVSIKVNYMKNSKPSVNPFSSEPLIAELAIDISELIVKTDSVQYAEENYIPKLFDRNPPSLLIIGERGSGKTTLMQYLRNRILNNQLMKRVLPIYLGLSVYNISSKQDFGSEFYSNFLLNTINAIVAREGSLHSEVNVRDLHHILSSKYIEETDVTDQLEEIARKILKNVSSNYEVLWILIDNLDKYVPEVYQDVVDYLDEYGESYERTMVHFVNSIGLELTYAMAAAPKHHNVALKILKKMKSSDIISIDLDWDLGYLYELARKRLAFSPIGEDSKIQKFFDDKAIFRLYLACQKNPRLFQSLCKRSIDAGKEFDSLPVSELIVERVIAELRKVQPFWYQHNREFVRRYKQLLREIKECRSNLEKGKSLERLAEHIFESIDGISIKARRRLTKSGEIDILLKNERDDGVWKHLGDPICVECKNLNKPAGINVLRSFVDSVREKRTKTGILFSTKGVSGDKTKNARKKIREAFLEGIYILDFDMKDLEKVFDPKDFENMLEDKRYNLYMDID